MVDRLKNTEINKNRIKNVESCFGSSGQPLQAPNRVLIGEGVLMKMCRKKAKPRQFFLFNDILVYGTILLSKRRYSFQHIIPLEQIKVTDIEECDDDSDSDAKYGFVIKSRHKSFVVYTVNEKERNDWVTHISRCVESLLKNGHHPLPDEQHAAVWVPDSEASKCMRCNNTNFTVLNRRHHCRACGQVVCSKCSSKSFILEGISRRPVRVCDSCYKKLSESVKSSPVEKQDAQVINESSESEDEEVNQYVNHEAATFYQNNENNEIRQEKLI